MDQQFTSTLLQSETSSSLPTTTPWSIELHTRHLTHQYWILYLKGKHNNINVDKQLQAILKQIPLSTIHQSNPSRHYIKQLQHARKSLIDVRTQSYQHRQTYLNHLQSQRIEEGNINEAQTIRHIQSAERRQNCWRTFKLLRKGPQTSGGISHVLIPSATNPSSLTSVHTKQELDKTLIDRNIQHFQQAHGTPFTTTEIIE
jgi:hypothetical protein